MQTIEQWACKQQNKLIINSLLSFHCFHIHCSIFASLTLATVKLFRHTIQQAESDTLYKLDSLKSFVDGCFPFANLLVAIRTKLVPEHTNLKQQTEFLADLSSPRDSPLAMYKCSLR